MTRFHVAIPGVISVLVDAASAAEAESQVREAARVHDGVASVAEMLGQCCDPKAKELVAIAAPIAEPSPPQSDPVVVEVGNPLPAPTILEGVAEVAAPMEATEGGGEGSPQEHT